jgi:branched-chain amino acid transport system ATP-binding protein
MILQVDSITKSFGGLRALKGVSLALTASEIVGLIGPNGAGKTTLLNVIAGVHRPDSGHVYLTGANVTGLAPEALSRRGLARTFQIAQAFPQLTAFENVLVAARFGGEACPRKEAEPLARRMLNFVEFPVSVDTLAGKLNTAQLKRVDLARALASRPRLLLLDEVAAGLTPSEIRDLIRLIRAIRDTGVALVVVEHLMRVIQQVCDRVGFLDSGEIIAEGTPEQIVQDARVVDAYLGSQYSR